MSNEQETVTSAQTSDQQVKVSRVKVSERMSHQTRMRVENLLNDQVQGLTGYISEMKEFTVQAIKHLPFSRQSEIDAVSVKRAQLQLQVQMIETKEKDKLRAVTLALEEEYKQKIKVLTAQLDDMKAKWSETVNVTSEMVREEYRSESEGIISEIAKLDATSIELLKAKSLEGIVTQAALNQNFVDLQVQIGDQANRARRHLWTKAVTNEDADVALDMLPETSKFREKVTPTHFFGLFNQAISGKQLTTDLKCKFCGSSNINMERGTGYATCIKCQRSGVLDINNVIKPLALPTLKQIVGEGLLER